MFRPKIIGFVCNWSLPIGMDITSSQGTQGRPKMHAIRVMCVGRIDPVIVLETFAQGADGVLMIGCPSPDCHYTKGNLQAEQKVKVLKKLLSLTGLEPERLRLDQAYAADIESFAKIVDDFRDQVAMIGRSPVTNHDGKILLNVMAAKSAASDFRLRVLTRREEELTEARNVYGEVIPEGEFDKVLDEVVREEFTRHKIHLLAKQKPFSVKELAPIMELKPAEVLCHIVDMRRKGMIALDHVEDTTPLYKSLEV